MTPYGCSNRPVAPPYIEVQDGWTADGRRRMVVKPYPFKGSCQYDKRATDERCSECRERT